MMLEPSVYAAIGAFMHLVGVILFGLLTSAAYGRYKKLPKRYLKFLLGSALYTLAFGLSALALFFGDSSPPFLHDLLPFFRLGGVLLMALGVLGL